MTYIKPPTQKEKEEYWAIAKYATRIFTYIIIGLTVIGTFGYLFYKYPHTMQYWTLVSLIFIAIALFTLLISIAFAACYSQLYISWHMINKRHRIGYYSSFMNSLILSILSTIVISMVTFCTYYDIFTNAFKMKDNNIFTIGLKIAVAVSIIFIIAITIQTILHVREEKPSLPPITEQEHEGREFLKDLYFYILRNKGFQYINSSITIAKINYLGELDYYINHGVYNQEQVEKWEYNLIGEISTEDEIFNEMSLTNKRNDEKLHQEVCEKARKEIEKVTLNKYDYIRNNEDKLKKYFNEYLD